MKNINIKFAITLVCLAVVLFLATLVIFSCTPIAKADSEIEVVLAPVSNLKDNAYAGVSTLKVRSFDIDEDIYIPESYYLSNPTEVTGRKDRYFVDYCGTQFVLETADLQTSTVTFEGDTNPNPDLRLTLKDDITVTVEETVISNDYTIKLVGFNHDGSQIYVRATLNAGSLYGFVPTDSFLPFNVPYHPIAQAERDKLIAVEPEPIIPGGEIVPNTSLALRVILIIGIAVPAVIIALLLFKPSKSTKRMLNNKRKDDYDYDDPRRSNRTDDRYSGNQRDDRYSAPDDRYSSRDNGYTDRRDDYPPRDNGYANRDYDDRYAPRRDGRYDDRNDRYNR